MRELWARRSVRTVDLIVAPLRRGYLDSRRVWISATTSPVAHWAGFITLIRIVSRNSIVTIAHYIHLMRYEGMPFGEEKFIRGSVERLTPVMMTAAISFIRLLPLLFGAGQTGKVALVAFGGMLASTRLDQLVTPVLFQNCRSVHPSITNPSKKAITREV